MNVLFFSSEFPGPHDPVRAVFNLRMCRLLDRQHDVRVVSPVAWIEALATSLSPGASDDAGLVVRRHRYFYPPRTAYALRGTFMWWSLHRKLRAAMSHWRPDVVVSYWTHPDGEVALRFARSIGVPVVQMVGGSDVLCCPRSSRRWERVTNTLRAVDAVVTIGRHLAEEIKQLGVRPDRLFSVYRPVDDTLFCPGVKAEARGRLGLDRRPLILWVGRFSPEKGLDILLEAVHQVRAAVPDVRVQLIGDGPDAARFRARLATEGLTNIVEMVGPVSPDALPDWYRSADVVALPSRSEGVPNVLLEAISCGVPFVASAVGGVPEIADTEIDRLVSPGDANALARALVDVLKRTGTQVRRKLPISSSDFSRQFDGILQDVTRGRAWAGVAS